MVCVLISVRCDKSRSLLYAKIFKRISFVNGNETKYNATLARANFIMFYLPHLESQ